MRKLATTITELAMLLYWGLAGALALNMLSIDPALMYSDYQNPLVVAWNWSFFPVDIAFAVIGLTARNGSLSATLRFKLDATASVLMVCAGLMAVSFWTITGDFSPTWWAMNLWLMGLGLLNLFWCQLDLTQIA